MQDLISREAAIDALVKWYGCEPSDIGAFENIIEKIPSADVAPVRRGHWDTVEDWDGDEHYQCSECGAEFVLIDGTPQDNDYLYCPHCGARMDGET